jgi:hypothetical protein
LTAAPFVRCGVCNLDQHRLSVVCKQCGADLGTPEQQAFNAQMWADLKHAEAQTKAEDAIPRRVLTEAQADWVDHHLRQGLEPTGLAGLELIADKWVRGFSPPGRRKLRGVALGVGVALVLAGVFAPGPFILRLAAILAGSSLAYLLGPTALRGFTPEDE